MTHTDFKPRLPGYIATGLLILVTSFWTFWGVAEMWHEGWGMPFPHPLRYLILGAVCLGFTLIALTWPRLGGWLLLAFGGAFSVWWSSVAAGRGWLNWQWVLTALFPLAGMLVVVGVLFLLEGRYRRRLRAEGWSPPVNWLHRNLRYVLGVGIPLLMVVVTSAFFAPMALSRVDDGDRSARLIEGHGVALVWAPKGPGWNWKQPWGGYPSWDMIALYGVQPVGFEDKPGYEDRHATPRDMATTGLCRYLSADGMTLMAEPQDVWRLPTAEEIVRSLVGGGQNAGCALRRVQEESEEGESWYADCIRRANKDTPLWAPDEEPIYYWSADEYDGEEAWYVPYNGGGLGYQPKEWGNPRHGYRCVREP